jgi:hypothetical protein
VAPGHSFDSITIELLRERGVSAISDGFFRRAVRWQGVSWVPQQLWRFRSVGPGLWTVCLHHNHIGPAGVERLRHDIDTYSTRLTDLKSCISGELPEFDWRDGLVQRAWLLAVRARRRLAGTKG